MNRILTLKTIKDIRTMTDPYRLRIMKVFKSENGQSLTVKDIAKILDEPHGKVYYHMKKMVDLGAFEVVKTEKINGITAKYYAPTFDELRVEDQTDGEGSDDIRKDAYTTMISNLFDEFRDSFVKFLLEVNHDAYDYKPGEKYSSVSGKSLFFNEASYTEFQSELNKLLDKHSSKLDEEEAFEKTFFYAAFTELKKEKS